VGGGRCWWAHLAYTPINIALTMVKKEFEELTIGKKEIEETPSSRISVDHLDLRAFQGATKREMRFTIPIDGAIGPEPHPGFIEVSRPAPAGHGDREVEGAGEGGTHEPIRSVTLILRAG
jgi:hypothetical protein